MNSTGLEHYMNYNSIPLSKRIEKQIQSEKRNLNHEIRGRDVNWRSGINTIDPETGLSPLMVAILQGKKDIVVALIERGANVEAVDTKKGRTPLQIAAKEGHYEILKELFKRDAVINSTDNHRKTALMHASKGGYLDCVNALLNRGAGVNMIDDNGYTALHYASKFGHHQVVVELIKAAASIESRDNLDGYAALHFAAQYGRKETVISLLDYGARINRRTIKEKLTPLMLASREGNKTIVSLLISKGAEVNVVDIHGWTALHFAASWGRRDTAHILIVDGEANVNARDPTREGIGGTTPLIVAAKGSQITVMKLLIHYGASINLHEEHFGQNPIIAAAELGLSDVIQCLIDYHAEINFQNPFTGMTALMTAAANGKRGALITLLNHYADMNIIDLNFRTAFEHADRNHQRDILLSAIVHITPAAKTNLLPWLEVHCPLLIRQSTYGGPSVFLNSFLYEKKGAFYGLYNATRDRDVYLIYFLITLMATCQQSKQHHPRDIPDLQQKIQTLETMVTRCLTAREMCNDYIFVDCFLLGQIPSQELQDSEVLKYFFTAFHFGPLAVYLENDLSQLLTVKVLRDKIDTCFWTWIKPVNLLIDGYGKASCFLLYRYCPVIVFLLEGVSQALLLAMILGFTLFSHPSSEYYQKTTNTDVMTNRLDGIELFLMIMIAGFFFYQIGLLEEKRWMISPSMIFDYPTLEQVRHQKMRAHFFENPWNFLDGLTMLLTMTWLVLRLVVLFGYPATNQVTSSAEAYYLSLSGEILLLAVIPLSVGLLRYPACFSVSLDIELLTIFQIFYQLLTYFFLFATMVLAFGLLYYSIYHLQIDSFASYPKTLETLFNGILLNYDPSLFDGSRNELYGILLSGCFLIITVFILFNGMIGNIAANYHNNRQKAEEWSGQIKARWIQRYGLVLEKSAFCMLPPPWNAVLIVFYPCHVYYIWRSRLALEKRTAMSIGGTLSDYLLGITFLIPAAIYEYIMVDVMKPDNGFLYSCLYAPVGILYILCCLLYKMMAEPYVSVILKSRISDGRVKISYSVRRDWYEEQSLIQFEDSRIYKPLQAFSAPIFSVTQQMPGSTTATAAGAANGGAEIFSLLSENSLSKLTAPNQRKKTAPMMNENPEERPSLLEIVWSKVFQKRRYDSVGQQVRIAPTLPSSPFLQLNNVQELEQTLSGMSPQKKPSSLLEHEQIYRMVEQKKEQAKRRKVWLASDFHSEYHASMIVNPVSEVEAILQKNEEKPPLLWTSEPAAVSRDPLLGQDLRPKTSQINPYQPGILVKAQWDELAAEMEPKQPSKIALSATFQSNHPTSRPVTSAAIAPAFPTAADGEEKAGPWTQTIPNPSILLHRPGSPQLSIEESMISPMNPQFLLPPQREKIAKNAEYFHHQDNYHLIDEQAIDHFQQLNSPSLYFQLSKFPPVFTESERKEIFQQVLQPLFLDDFAYQLESNEKYLIELKVAIQSLQKLAQQQNAIIQELHQRIATTQPETSSAVFPFGETTEHQVQTWENPYIQDALGEQSFQQFSEMHAAHAYPSESWQPSAAEAGAVQHEYPQNDEMKFEPPFY